MSTKTIHSGSIEGIDGEVKRAGRKVAYSPVVEALTRVGYGVRGLIYVMMGILALSFTLGKGGAPVDAKGAIAAIGKSPVGMVLLWVVLIGLVSYALWGVIRAVFDPLHKGSDIKGLIARAGFLSSAAGYAALVPFTLSLVTGKGGTSQGGAGTQQTMASIMSMPWGRYVIGLIGLAMIANGVVQIYLGLKTKFDKQYQSYAMTVQQVKIATQLGRFGTAARGFVFGVVGILVCTAAFQSTPSQPVGFDAALTSLLHQPYGIYLLAIVAVGLVAFGIYSMLSAIWFRARR